MLLIKIYKIGVKCPRFRNIKSRSEPPIAIPLPLESTTVTSIVFIFFCDIV